MVQKGKTGPAGAASTGPSITVDKVLATAMKMIEESGVDAFSMRKLAAELGVGTPTVYWHVGNRDELFNRLIEEITDQFGSISPRGRTPAERIASISNALLREVRAHPQLIALSKTQGRGEAIFTKAQAVLAHELTASGLHGEEAAFAVATILLHLGGFIVLEDALSPDYRVRGAQVWAQGDTEIDETMSTTLQQEVDLDRIFRFTLDAILQSILGDPERVIDRLSGRAIDASIAVTQQGPRDPTVSKVVLVHGAMDRAKSFLPVVEHLPDLRVVEYDRRGYGESLPAGQTRGTGAACGRPARASWAMNPPRSSPTVLDASWPSRQRSSTPVGSGDSASGSLRCPGWNSGPHRSGGGSRQWRPRPTRMPSPSGCTYRWWGRRRGGASPKNSRRVGVPRAWPFRATSSSDSVRHFAGRTSRCPACSASALRRGPSPRKPRPGWRSRWARSCSRSRAPATARM